MNRSPSGSKRWTAGARLAAWAAGVAMLAGCPGDGARPVVSAVPDARTVTSRDDALRVALPVDLLVHRLDEAVFATSADGKFRLYVRHDEGDELIKAVGAAKEILNVRGWDFVTERHLERASLLTLELRKRPRDPPAEHRTMWFFKRGGRVVVCDGIATPEQIGRLGEPLKLMCQRVAVAVAEEAPPPDAQP